jgi:hypothetical protein
VDVDWSQSSGSSIVNSITRSIMIKEVLKEKAKLIKVIVKQVGPLMHESGFSRGVGIDESIWLCSFGNYENGVRIVHFVGDMCIEGFTDNPSVVIAQPNPVPAMVTRPLKEMYYEQIHALHKFVMGLKDGQLK